jgi:transcriptional regulator with XRE-family HTH domain
MDSDGLLVDLGHVLREIRVEARVSQEELSLRTGVHRNYVGGVERAERNPTVLTVAKLAEALGITMADLFASVDRAASERTRPE